MTEPIRSGGILAAGEGSRLQGGGRRLFKPLVEVGGRPLIGHVIDNFLAAGIETIAMIVNEEETEVVKWVRSGFPEADVRILVKTTASSFESFRAVCSALPAEGRALISTVDWFCLPRDFLRFVADSERLDPHACILAVTPFVRDEKPLWVQFDEGGRIRAIGGSEGRAATAGLYVIPPMVRLLRPPEMPRLRDYLGWLLREHGPMYGVPIEKVIDVDHPSDLEDAEILWNTLAGRRP